MTYTSIDQNYLPNLQLKGLSSFSFELFSSFSFSPISFFRTNEEGHHYKRSSLRIEALICKMLMKARAINKVRLTTQLRNITLVISILF